MHVCFVVSMDLTFPSLYFTVRMSSVGTGRKIFCGIDDSSTAGGGRDFFLSVLYLDRLWGTPRLLRYGYCRTKAAGVRR